MSYGQGCDAYSEEEEVEVGTTADLTCWILERSGDCLGESAFVFEGWHASFK